MSSDYDIEEDYLKVDVDRSKFDSGNLLMADYFSTPPMFFTKDMSNVPFINRYNNGHAFLIASGPSFKNIDKNKLGQPGILTMGLNNSPASFRPNLWTCVDTPSNFLASIWIDPTIEKIVPISHINKKLFDSSRWKETDKTVGDCPNVFYYRRNEVVNTDQYCFEDTINWGNHSKIGGGRSVLLAAMRILFLMGVRNVYLLGVDFKMDDKNKYHFPQDRTKGSIIGNNNTYESMNKWFTDINKHFKKIGHNVYNCNPDSSLGAFEYISFDEAINKSLKLMPDVNNEVTDGMYNRRTDSEKKEKEKRLAEEAKKYTDSDRKKIKEKLDECRRKLDNCKESVNSILQREFPDLSRECYLWAHKLKKPNDDKLLKLYNIHKENIKSKTEPSDPLQMELYKAQLEVDRARRRFKNTEKSKNKIWGIFK